MNGVTLTLEERIFMIGDVARAVERSEQTVRKWADSGRLPSIRAANGQRLFKESDVLQFAAKLRAE